MLKSHRAGVGKTLKVHRLFENLLAIVKDRDDVKSSLVTISLHSRIINDSDVTQFLLEHCCEPDEKVARIFHINIAPEVLEGVDHLLFNLLVLGCLTDSKGYVWHREMTDLYAVECMPVIVKNDDGTCHSVHFMLNHLPSVTCWSPQESLDILTLGEEEQKMQHPDWIVTANDQLMDEKQFISENIQRVYQTLTVYDNDGDLNTVDPGTPHGTPTECIQCLLKHCGLEDPSWSELCNFTNFMSTQLEDCQQSEFCKDYLSDDLPGFKVFVLRFMLRMSKDFATRSLNISEETPGKRRQSAPRGLLHDYAMKRKWETSPHPYLFFNSDHESFTFLGFVINRFTQEVLDPETGAVIEQHIMSRELNQALYRNKVDLNENFNKLERAAKIQKICCVMGQQLPEDRDESYELTTDNVKKMLAIYMRFRCGIPVIVMGETGCGKTRLIKFLCDLWKPAGVDVQNMILMKVHGGTTEKDIEKKVDEALGIAHRNKERYPELGTVLFFDEANTTEAIGLLKEIMCDGTVNGRPIDRSSGLHFVVACNPYRKHSDEMIKRQEQAGLGYHVDALETRDRIGYIPMRHLVYRVQALPESVLPLVWDFGQLNAATETLYVRQMVRRWIQQNDGLDEFNDLQKHVTDIIVASQEFMREQKDECSFVSLRDADRLLRVTLWFYTKGVDGLYEMMNIKAEDDYQPPSDAARSLILALGVCYHACLQRKREEYREHVSKFFDGPLALEDGPHVIDYELSLLVTVMPTLFVHALFLFCVVFEVVFVLC